MTNSRPGNIIALTASQDYFAAASRWRTVQLVVVIIIPAFLATWGVFSGHPVFWIPLFGFGAAVADSTFFNYLISESRYHAAQLASEYDASLVARTAARCRLAGSPSRDNVIMHSDAFTKGDAGRERAQGWHYERILELDFPVAELLYIRSDLAHDECLREPYVTLLAIVFIIGFVGLIAVAGAYGWNIGDIAATVLVPALPVATWLGREIVDQFLALRRKRDVRELLDNQLFNEQINPSNSCDPLIMERESLHGMQFLFRATQPSVAGWYVARRSEKVHQTTKRVLDERISDALHAGHGRSPQPPGDSTQG